MKAKKRGRGKPAIKKPARRKRAPSPVLASIRDTMAGLHQAGVVTTATMREFDQLCLEPVVKLVKRKALAVLA